MIVGAYALAFYGAPRYTGDIDILVKPSIENAQKILTALAEFGFGSLNLTANDFLEPGYVIQLGMPPVRIDILTSITGVSWEDADNGKTGGQYDDLNVYYLGKVEYKKNKLATGRKKDLADLELIGELTDE